MSEIIKMAAITMSSLELLDLVNGARRQFGETEVRRNDFVARCKDELEGEYYETFVVRNQRGPASEAIKMTRDQCMYVLMRESKAVRRAVTERLKALEAPAVPQTLPEALRLAAEAIEERDRLALESKAKDAALAEAAPKVEVFERIADATGSMTLRETATTLKYPERKLILWMQQNNWLYRRPGRGTLLGYAEKIKAGHLEHKVTVIHNDRTGEDETRESVRVTSLGLTVLARRLASVTEELPALYGAHCGQGVSLEARP